ncbi:uncharacterized protein LOC131234460 isoform X1 [Magnolia sinica]|uniref:uncharacterized protein LOC131234460 isoform X1 n=1 Tax=Magnolia sinica TaxID=86752 RepID=UPI002659A8B6|nr:uncharacterized protein LOC131234460 isoform X1 [Magnolia sinica]
MEFTESPYASATDLALQAASIIPISHYLLGFMLFLGIFFYNFLEIHLFRDLIRGFRGDAVSLTFNPCSEIYHGVVSKCRVLHGRFLPTLWLSSPHLQTAFLSIFGRAPVCGYKRHVFHASDGGTIALDWLVFSNGSMVSRGPSLSQDDTTPIVVVIPGLTSDSDASYIKHLAFKIAKRGWKVVVSNHRGLGGISMTSDRFYNAGWTEDLRKVVNHLHQEHPQAPLFAVGTSIGANILVKYLGEDGENTPIAGAASICSPWDLVVCDRFINRKLVQKLYGRILTIGLQGFAQLHEPIYSRLADWEGIQKSRSVRDFDQYATCLVGKFETVDTYYRHCSSASFVANVSVPLLCISALDDPLCTKEAIPWDECRANKNVVLATTTHGGHLAFFEGITANRLWWVRAVDEFLSVLHSSPFMHRKRKMQTSGVYSSLESLIDKSPYVNVMEDGMVMALDNDQINEEATVGLSGDQIIQDQTTKDTIAKTDRREDTTTQVNEVTVHDTAHSSNQNSQFDRESKDLHDIIAPVRKCLHQLTRQNGRSMWLLAYIAIVTTWPLVGSALLIIFKRRLRNVLPAAWLRK